MENQMENWNRFLNKQVRIIINDAPSVYPKHKDGLVKGFTTTHILLQQQDQDIALLLTDIRRIEIRNKTGGAV